MQFLKLDAERIRIEKAAGFGFAKNEHGSTALQDTLFEGVE